MAMEPSALEATAGPFLSPVTTPLAPAAEMIVGPENGLDLASAITPGSCAAERIAPARTRSAGERALIHRLAVLALLIGALFRILQYLGNRSLWQDEALVLPWFQNPGFAELLDPARLRPLPAGFLVLEKLLAHLFGDWELVLRLVPLIGGFAALAFCYGLARETLSQRAVPVAMALVALSPFLIYYASELKPYSTDVAATSGVLLLAAHLRQREITWRRAAAWGAAALLAIWISLAAVFAISASALVLLAGRLFAGERRAAWRLLSASVPAGLLFMLPYIAGVLQPGEAVPAASEGPGYMQSFWSSGFMPLPPASAAEWMWFPRTALRVFQDPLGLLHAGSGSVTMALALLSLAAFGIGVFSVGRWNAALLLSPVVLTLVASGLGRYPFGADWNTGGRVILFLVPCFLLVMAGGLAQIHEWLPARFRLLWLVPVAVLVLPPLAQAATTVPYGRGELKPLLEFVAENRQPGDRLYVHYDALPAFRYYAERYGIGPDEYVPGVCARFSPEEYLEALSGLRGNSRVWVMFTGGRGAGLFDERGLMVDFLNHIGRRIDDRVARGTFVYLYDLSYGLEQGSGYRARLPVMPENLEEGCSLWQ